MKAMKARQESTSDDNKMRKWANKNNITLGKLAIAAAMKAMPNHCLFALAITLAH